MTQEEFQKLVLERFGLLAELERTVKRIERNYRRIARHPELPDQEEWDDVLDDQLEDLEDEEQEEGY